MFNLFTKRFIPIILLTISFSLSWMLNPTTVLAKNTSIHIHIQSGEDLISNVSVLYKGDELPLEQKNPKLYTVKKPDEIVKPDISEIIVTKTDGTVETFTPAEQYAGVEGKGSINYWIEISSSNHSISERNDDSETTSSEQNEDHLSDNRKVDDKNKEGNDQNNQSSQNEYPKTVDGGELPNTSTPWFNFLLLSVLTAGISGIMILALKKFHINS
ncbi:hypothetical protein [Salirhabdus salicampi]|uniref:hypothetical protein n=1 Tax=Salirhabdus salicampi TaxID=476102 RepID=UPI0020C2FA9F|nr:hypothetical protein [Salirhabdus salicampi]MCP8616237.1 hypothetical protein [Salirhabdus salicampi]